MWIRLQGSAEFLVKIEAGGINVVTGGHAFEVPAEGMQGTIPNAASSRTHQAGNSQDYILSPKQEWVNGTHHGPRELRQFVVRPFDSDQSTHVQLVAHELCSHLKFSISPTSEYPPYARSLVVKVVTLMDHTFNIWCINSWTTRKLKKVLFEHSRCHPEEQCLTFRGAIMQGDGSCSITYAQY